MNEDSPFLQAFRGSFSGILRWPQLDELWHKVLHDDTGWYVYAVGEAPPTEILAGSSLTKVVKEMDELLRNEHDEEYCGIVYVDDTQTPSYIKIFDPNNLGSVCGSSGNPPLPGWIISKMQPINLPAAMPQPNNRRRWWQKLFAHA